MATFKDLKWAEVEATEEEKKQGFAEFGLLTIEQRGVQMRVFICRLYEVNILWNVYARGQGGDLLKLDGLIPLTSGKSLDAVVEEGKQRAIMFAEKWLGMHL